jgi:type IV pilus assembly protein PilW
MRMVTASYFVAPSQVSPGNNSLWVRLGSDAPAELAAGVDNLQILYGEDTDNDLTANRYVTADQVADMRNVVSVRISLLMRSLEDNVAQAPQTYAFNDASPVTPTDRRLRVVLTTVVNLRNRTP